MTKKSFANQWTTTIFFVLAIALTVIGIFYLQKTRSSLQAPPAVILNDLPIDLIESSGSAHLLEATVEATGEESEAPSLSPAIDWQNLKAAETYLAIKEALSQAKDFAEFSQIKKENVLTPEGRTDRAMTSLITLVPLESQDRALYVLKNLTPNYQDIVMIDESLNGDQANLTVHLKQEDLVGKVQLKKINKRWKITQEEWLEVVYE